VEIAVLATAFAGLALALDVGVAGASAAGLALASMAALGALASFVIIERALDDADSVRATATASAAAAAASLLALVLGGAFALPATATGWSLLACVLVLFTTAVTCMFLAIRHAGAVSASMLLCLEPITAVVLALLLLGETLGPVQWLGAALVIAAVTVAGTRRAVEAPGSIPAARAAARTRSARRR